LPADYISADQAVAMICAWLKAVPLQDEHQGRVAMIDQV